MSTPCLYLVWFGPQGDREDLFGVSSCSHPPSFDTAQVHAPSITSLKQSRLALLSLPNRMLLAYNSAWSGTGVLPGPDSGIGWSFCQNWPNWQGNQNVPVAATSWSPALALWGPGAIMVWNGIGSDTRIWWAQYYTAQNTWSVQSLTQINNAGPVKSASTPAIVNWNGKLFMVWRGEGSNDSLYFATSSDGQHWTGNSGIPGAASTIQPAILVFNGNVIIAFKGGENDTSIYTTTYHAATNSWAPVVSCGPFGTSHGPCLALYGGQIFMAWKGVPGDRGIYYATSTDNLNPKAWTVQHQIGGVGTDVGPSAAVY